MNKRNAIKTSIQIAKQIQKSKHQIKQIAKDPVIVSSTPQPTTIEQTTQEQKERIAYKEYVADKFKEFPAKGAEGWVIQQIMASGMANLLKHEDDPILWAKISKAIIESLNCAKNLDLIDIRTGNDLSVRAVKDILENFKHNKSIPKSN